MFVLSVSGWRGRRQQPFLWRVCVGLKRRVWSIPEPEPERLMRFLHDTRALSISRQSELLSKQSSSTLHSPDITLLRPLSSHNLMILHNNTSLSLALSVILNINTKISKMFSSNHIRGQYQYQCTRGQIDYALCDTLYPNPTNDIRFFFSRA